MHLYFMDQHHENNGNQSKWALNYIEAERKKRLEALSFFKSIIALMLFLQLPLVLKCNQSFDVIFQFFKQPQLQAGFI